MTFKEFQSKFVQSISSNLMMENLGDFVEPVGKLNIEGVFSTYRDDYQARLFAALSQNFESAETLLGRDLFFQLAINYILTHPSPYFDLAQIGNEFPEFLRNHPISVEVPEIPEIAQMDLDFWWVFNNANQSGMNAEQFSQGQISEDTRFQLVHSLLLRRSEMNIGNLWQDLRDKNPASKWSQSDHGQIYFWMIYKTNYQVKIKTLDRFSYEILQLLSNNSCLGEALADLGQRIPDASPQQIQEFFSFLSAERLVHKFV